MFEQRDELSTTAEHALALACLEAGIEAAHPRVVVAEMCALEGENLTISGTDYDLRAYDRVVVLGGGNAAGHVAAALEDVLGDRIDDGIVVTDDPVDTDRVTICHGTHPVPDAETAQNARRVLKTAKDATEGTLVLAIITGGGSSLMTVPEAGIILEEICCVTNQLLTAGAGIDELNTVRKHLSAIKGGRLAQAIDPAHTVALIFSDVVGNSLSDVASGPTVPDATTYADAIAVLNRYLESIPTSVYGHLAAGKQNERLESVGERSVNFQVDNHILADGGTALEAAREKVVTEGYRPLLLSQSVRGEAREIGKAHLAIAEEVRRSGNPLKPPAVLLSGGETTVTVDGDGYGGPNQEFALSSALELEDSATVIASVDTDGIDGATDAAGAIVDATSADADAHTFLENNDAYHYLEDAGALLRCGPTGTNVNDLRVVIVGRKS